ncbi:hypothetical protein ANN_00460 [Periplaneta americana]|uniref:Reverse transcriptase domain-containing protein n=1 Tax=Periplaneta americana TaxID=6978 RepID=A0ABQ8TQW7_PERAM|nr:hypothetical protein ANN_00460 [Periplaneta americana]
MEDHRPKKAALHKRKKPNQSKKQLKKPRDNEHLADTLETTILLSRLTYEQKYKDDSRIFSRIGLPILSKDTLPNKKKKKSEKILKFIALNISCLHILLILHISQVSAPNDVEYVSSKTDERLLYHLCVSLHTNDSALKWQLHKSKQMSNTNLLPPCDDIIRDHQCGFRRNRSTIDQIFCIRQIMEKKWEYKVVYTSSRCMRIGIGNIFQPGTKRTCASDATVTFEVRVIDVYSLAYPSRGQCDDLTLDR